MDRLRNTLTQHGVGAAGLVPHERPVPVASSLRWVPVGTTAQAQADAATLPIFVTQGTLAAMHDHVRAGTGGISIGLLLGDVCIAPDTGTRFLVIEATICLPWRVSTDETGPVMEDALAAVLPDLRARGAVVGWYTSHLLAEGALSPSDVAIHERFFDQPWQVALVVGPPPKRLGGVFRRSARAGWESDPLPFYELLDPASLLPTGRKATDLAWQNYRTTEDAIRADRPLNPPQEQPRTRLLFPDEPEEGAVPAARPRWWGGPTRMAAFGAVGLLAAVGLVTIYELGASRSAAALGSPPAVADASPLDRLDRTADTLALALAAFDVRARLFGRGQMGCPELAHGLVEVEERWIAYGAARKNVVVLDSARRARDGSQYAEVDAVERRFERLKCPRP